MGLRSWGRVPAPALPAGCRGIQGGFDCFVTVRHLDCTGLDKLTEEGGGFSPR